MEGMGLVLWTWAWISAGFVAGAAWAGLGIKNKSVDAMLDKKNECCTCPVNHIKEDIENG